MFGAIKLKAIAILTAIGGILMLTLAGERKKRKSAELKARIEESNRRDLERKAEIVDDIDKERRNWDDKIRKEHKERNNDVENFENLNDSEFINSSSKLLKRSNSPNKTH